MSTVQVCSGILWDGIVKLENRTGQGCQEPSVPSFRGLLTISLFSTLLGHLWEWFSYFCYHPTNTTLSKDLNLPLNSN